MREICFSNQWNIMREWEREGEQLRQHQKVDRVQLGSTETDRARSTGKNGKITNLNVYCILFFKEQVNQPVSQSVSQKTQQINDFTNWEPWMTPWSVCSCFQRDCIQHRIPNQEELGLNPTRQQATSCHY
jgi:hypothetical protein